MNKDQIDILLVEDDEVTSEILVRTMSLWDNPPLLRSVTTLALALNHLKSNRVDVVLLDLNLPDSRGAGTVASVVNAASGAVVIALTSSDDEKLAHEALSYGADDFLTKGMISYRNLKIIIGRSIERGTAATKVRTAMVFLQSTLDGLASQIAILDQHGVIHAVNAAWRSYVDAKELKLARYGVGTKYIEIPFPQLEENQRESIRHGIGRVLQSDCDTFSDVYSYNSPDRVEWFRMRVSRFHDDNKAYAIVAHEDITSEVVAESLRSEHRNLRESIKGMEHLLGVIGHEIRTPLAAIRLSTEYLIMLDDSLINTHRQFIEGIHSEVLRLSQMVNNMLEAARLSSGTAHWNWGEVRMKELCDESAAIIRNVHKGKSLSMEVCMEPKDIMMLGDSEAILRLILNLLSNAYQHTDTGFVRLDILQPEERRWIEIRVTDTGCGINSEIASRLGMAFALNQGIVGAGHISGTGLGLSICKDIVAAHGGTIQFQTSPGHGTTFIVRMRADLPESSEVVNEASMVIVESSK